MASSARTGTSVRTWLVANGYEPQLRDPLADRGDLKLVSAESAGGVVDVVLLEAARGVDVAAELAAVRERVSAPVVIAVAEEARDALDEIISLNPDDIIVLPQPADVVAFVLRKTA